jgi:hypothetical protein
VVAGGVGVVAGATYGAGAGTTGIGGVGGDESVTSGALARALPSALTAPAPAAALAWVLAGGAGDMVSDTTGILRTCRRMITCRPPATRRATPARAVRVVTVRVGTVVRVAAARAGAAAARAGVRVSFGDASAGKRATGSDSSGNVMAAAAGGFMTDLTDAAIRLA